MFSVPVINDWLLQAWRAWNWLRRGLHVFALPLLLLSPGYTAAGDSDAIDPDFWTT